MKMKALAFAPYEAMKTMIQDIQKQYQELSIDIIVGTYDDYLEMQSSINLCEYDCIFARGYTAQMMKSASLIPVSEIKVSLYDMLRVIAMARLRNVPFAILASANILEIAHQIIDILQYHQIITCAINSEEDAAAQMEGLRHRGVQLVLGDVYAVNAAQKANLPALLITSSRTSIEEAVQDAISNRQQHLQIYEKLNLTSEVIRNYSVSILVYDQNRQVVLSNVLGLPVPYRRLEKRCFKLLEKITKTMAPAFCTCRLEDTVLRIKGCPIMTEAPYVAFYVQAVQMPQLAARQEIQVLYPSDETTLEILDKSYELPGKYLHGKGVGLSAHSPTVIVGGDGSGKLLLAKYLWCTGDFRDVSLVLIDGSILTAAALQAFIDDPVSPLYDPQLVLLVKDLQFLSAECQKILCGFLEDTSFSTRHPLVVTSLESPNTLFAQRRLLLRLCDYLVGPSLRIESLSRRPDDLAAVAGTLIGKYNMELGKEVIGLTPEALQALQHFQWSSNLNQLKSVLRYLVSTASQHYIEREQAEEVLKTLVPEKAASSGPDFTGTLDEIEQRAVLSVLRQENMNYAAAARRLDISRSTLYRKLKGIDFAPPAQGPRDGPPPPASAPSA